MFDAEKVKNEIILWIREWFMLNGNGCKAVVGISGGKDSSVVAALCTEALGSENEDYVGYSTRYGDAAGDFSPLSNLTVEEVKAIGRSLNMPSEFIDKVPIDGLCGKTDEDNLGFTYNVLDKYIRQGVCEDESIKNKIDKMHKNNLFKLKLMDSFTYK